MSVVNNITTTKTNVANINSEQVEKQLDSLQKQEELLHAMSVQSKETIFETFGTGKNDSNAALVGMRGMRQEMRLVGDKGSAIVVAGRMNALR
eukprot:12596752-Ditylum_brightwellii.AAC.1